MYGVDVAWLHGRERWIYKKDSSLGVGGLDMRKYGVNGR